MLKCKILQERNCGVNDIQFLDYATQLKWTVFFRFNKNLQLDREPQK